MARDRLAALRAQQGGNTAPTPDYSYPAPAANRQESVYVDDYYSSPQDQQSYAQPDNQAYYSEPAQPQRAAPPTGLPSGPRRPQQEPQRRPTNAPSVSQNGRQLAQYAPVDPRDQGSRYAQPQRQDQAPPRPYQQQPAYQQKPSYQSSRQDSYEDEKKGRTPGSSQTSQESYEMKDRSRGGAAPTGGKANASRAGGKTIKAGDVPFEEMGSFFKEVSLLQNALRDTSDMIQSIQSSQLRLFALPSSDDPEAVRLAGELAQTTGQTRNLFTSIKSRLQILEQGNANLSALIPVGQSVHHLSLADVQTRKTQVSALKARFKEAIQRYAEVERDNRAKTRARMVRQIKIVSPQMGDAEIDEAVRNVEQGSGGNLFSQALMQGNGQRSYAAKGALREVESRAADIQRIEQTLVELAQMFNDMAVLVESQDVEIVQIERNAEMANKDMDAGVVQTKKAVKSARSARKWRWICFIIFILILIVVAIVVVVQVVLPLIKKNQAAAPKAAASTPAESNVNNLASTTQATAEATSTPITVEDSPSTTQDFVSGSGNGGYLSVPAETARAKVRRALRRSQHGSRRS